VRPEISQRLFVAAKAGYSCHMALKAILFDKDGTLVDFHGTWGQATYAAMLRMAAGDETKLARLVEANHYDVETRRVRPTSPLIAGSSADYGGTWAHILGEVPGAPFFARMDRILMEEAATTVVPLGDPLAIVAALKAEGLVLGIVTNDSEAGARAHCESLGLTPYLDDIFGYDSGHGRKPEPGPLLAFAERHGLAPAEIALVGDSLHDLHAARAAGALAIGVLSGLAGADELEPDADHLIADIMALPDLVSGLRAPGP
jgi:phosphoglycolate phosphatase